MLHEAKIAYYAFDVIRFFVPYAARLKLLGFYFFFFCKVYCIEGNIKVATLDELCFISILNNRTM